VPGQDDVDEGSEIYVPNKKKVMIIKEKEKKVVKPNGPKSRRYPRMKEVSERDADEESKNGSISLHARRRQESAKSEESGEPSEYQSDESLHVKEGSST